MHDCVRNDITVTLHRSPWPTPVICHMDGPGPDDVTVVALSMLGARREITGALIARGYAPVSPWVGDAAQPSRLFRK